MREDLKGQVWDVTPDRVDGCCIILLVMQRHERIDDGSWTRLCLTLEHEPDVDEVGKLGSWNEKWFSHDTARRIA